MGERIDRFCEDLRQKLTNIDSGLHGIKSKIDDKNQNAEEEVRSHLEAVHRHIEEERAKVSAAQAEAKEWAESQKEATTDKIAEWKAKRETTKLQNRADKAERYAGAVISVALATVDEAEEAALEAWLARRDADSAQAGQPSA